MKDVGRLRRSRASHHLQDSSEPIETTVFPSSKNSAKVCAELPETEMPNLRSGELVARMPSAGITNFQQASAFWLNAF